METRSNAEVNKMATPDIVLPSSTDFIALDFETANRDPASACAIGLAFVENGQIVANPGWLIRPPRLYFDPEFIKIHGIDAEQVRAVPDFHELWQSLEPHLRGRIVIAHNASFDINVLLNMLDHYKLPYPAFRYSCTKVIAQKTWPTWKRYSLAELAIRHNIVFHHHDAAEDARACATIALAAFEQKAVSCFDDLHRQIRLNYGGVSSAGHVPLSTTILLPDLEAFGGWDTPIHRKDEQVKRRQRAEGLSDSSVDHDAKSGVINGYDVTLEKCSCVDFRERRLPCKHIYYLESKLRKK
ncbi:MAG: 3'-5' exonuclease [Negativicutes bacterium]|nr:3'-5' exonuclease [Negativicutes bacterium]